MKALPYLLLCLIVCCTSEKKTEAIPADSLSVDSVSVQPQSNEIVEAEEPQTEEPLSKDLPVVSIVNNPWLEEYIRTPFEGIGIDSIVGLLRSKSIDVQFENGENGGIIFEESEIAFNRSYGDSYCLAEITSTNLPLGSGIAIGMTKGDFLNKVSFSTRGGSANQRLEFGKVMDEKTYTISFDFVNNLLVKFTYKTDPCVIYD